MTDFIDRLEGVAYFDYARRTYRVSLWDRQTGDSYTFDYNENNTHGPILIKKAKCELAEMWKEQPDV